ncbi:crossover junction endodeoxyribonuclease RuvC, partial [uncultured Rothia sp.]|uniref:crossover junction endodeoxyribonuclease RuvC n=1 Tax=uncultured Rothia sp. TaxID=316088 RepID=UPI0025F9A08A
MRENHTVAAVDRVPGATRIMGVDPGLTRCGFSMLDMTADRKAHFVNVGVAGTDPARTLDQRILWIFNAASHWLDTYRPDALAIERVFAQEQVNTVIGTAHASGAVISAAAMRGVPVFFHTPSEVKAAVTGSGRADKASVGRMVTRILGLNAMPKPADAADALAISICHGWRGGGIGSGINMSA